MPYRIVSPISLTNHDPRGDSALSAMKQPYWVDGLAFLPDAAVASAQYYGRAKGFTVENVDEVDPAWITAVAELRNRLTLRSGPGPYRSTAPTPDELAAVNTEILGA